MKDKFLSAINEEIRITAAASSDLPQIDTIYFGGGTPSLLTGSEVKDILDMVKNYFIIDRCAEITLEANPDDISAEKLASWKNEGINRLSIGLQSFDDAELSWMNRAHNAAESLNCLKLVQEAGISNFSVDLIYGSPLQTDVILLNNLALIIKLNVPHVSCYALTVEPQTALHNKIKKGKQKDVDDQVQARQYNIVTKFLESHGFKNYEISNFCQPGKESRHNSSYWNGSAYFGFGPSAHSFDGTAERRWNEGNNALYISSLAKNIIPYTAELLTPVQQHNEHVMIGLRIAKGINLTEFEKKFGKKFRTDLEINSEKYREKNLVDLKEDNLRLTAEGRFLADGIAADLFLDSAD